MSPLGLSIVVFVSVFSAALIGTLISQKLPDHHHSSESRDIVRLGMGLVATMVAVVLGLLIASAKGFFDTQSTELTQLAANILSLDRVLAQYGPGADDVRTELRTVLAAQLAAENPSADSNKVYTAVRSGTRIGDHVISKIELLAPADDNQRWLKNQALSLAFQLAQTRWLMYEQNKVPVPKLLFAMLLAWLIVLFMSFGIFAPRNFIVLAGMLVAAAAVSGAILLILELYNPQTGLIRVSDIPLRAAMEQLGR